MRIKYTMTRIYQSGKMETQEQHSFHGAVLGKAHDPQYIIMRALQRNGFKLERQGDCIIAHGTVTEFIIYIYEDMELEED